MLTCYLTRGYSLKGFKLHAHVGVVKSTIFIDLLIEMCKQILILFFSNSKSERERERINELFEIRFVIKLELKFLLFFLTSSFL